ncbi:MAG: hypothetical protein JO142_04350 [Burkholderiales bacterium]|nr:hypothetical protein [Burkholderiales bacterium]
MLTGQSIIALRARHVCWLLVASLACFAFADYNPLSRPEVEPTVLDLTVQDSARDREIPIRVMLPASKQPAPVILFSHGLGGTRTGSAFLGQHWSARGYVTVYIQHHGSDDAVWKGKPLLEGLAAMRSAASLDNFILRVEDIKVVLDQLTAWNGQKDNPLANRLDLAHIGMSGHSFGAVTTEAVSGEKLPGDVSATDVRIKAAIAFSPSVPDQAEPAEVFGAVHLPWMLMTGTKDSVPLLGKQVDNRMLVYPALPAGGKYELVLEGAEHSVFTDRALPGDHEPRNPNHHRVILALSTAFWDAWLKSDHDALAWLEGKGPSTVLEAADRWQHK